MKKKKKKKNETSDSRKTCIRTLTETEKMGKYFLAFLLAAVSAQRTSVTLLVFSGSPNPVWEISADQTLAIQQLNAQESM